MFKNLIAASVIALASLPAAAATLADYIPDASAQSKSVYVAKTGKVTLTYLGSDAGNYNIGYYVRTGDDLPLFVNKVSAIGSSVTLDGEFAAGTELVFSLTSVGSTITSFLTGTEYARAGNVAGYGFVVAFEDTKGGDGDYNDFVFGVSNATNSLPAVPAPAALPLIASAFGGMAMLRRRRRA